MPTTAADPTGGCLCGAVRYRLAGAPFDAGWCHCRTCQLNSGSPAMAFASIPTEALVIERGADALRQVASSAEGERWFCGECGTPLWMRDTSTDKTRDFSLATLDDPGTITPRFHIFTASAIAWAMPADGLPHYPRFRADGQM